MAPITTSASRAVGRQRQAITFADCRRRSGPRAPRRRSRRSCRRPAPSSAASLAASVPLPPMATPTSARLSAGASFTPSPVIATTAPCRLKRLHQPQLVLGAGAGEHVDLARRVRKRRVIAARSRSRPVDDLRVVGEAELPGDRPRGDRVIAGDHLHAGCRPRGSRARRRSPPGAADRSGPSRPRKVRPPSTSANARRALRPDAAAGRDGQHALSRAARLSTRRCQESRRAAPSPTGAAAGRTCEQPLRRAFDIERRRGRRASWCSVAMKRCRASNGISSMRAAAVGAAAPDRARPWRPATSSAPSIGSPSTSQSPPSADAAARRCTAGPPSNLGQERLVGGIDSPSGGRCRRAARSRRPVTSRSAVGRGYRLHGHLVAGERAGLVGADDA